MTSHDEIGSANVQAWVRKANALNPPHLKIWAERLDKQSQEAAIWRQRKATVKYWANRSAMEAMRPSYFDRFRTPAPPRPWWRRQWTKRTWRLRWAISGFKAGWRGELE